MSDTSNHTFQVRLEKEIKNYPKPLIIELALKITQDKTKIEELRLRCRNYLMTIEPSQFSIENCLEKLGYDKNGFEM